MSKFSFLLIFSLLGATCHGEKILFLLPLASRSHVHVFEPLMKALGERGHEIVSLSPIPSPGMPPSVRHVQIISVEDLVGDMADPFEQRRVGFIKTMLNTSSWEHMDRACLKVVKSPKFHEILKEKFDLVIVDLLLNYCVLGAIPILQAPSILVSTFAPPPIMSNVIGNRLPPSFVPSAFLQFSDHMSFKERVINTIMENFMSIIWETTFMSKCEKMYKENLPGGDKLPGIFEIQKNTSMMFANSHFTLTYPRPLLPDLIEVGGMHTRPAKKLPKDLDDFLSGSGEEGFIFFSLGSIVKPQQMPESTRKAFINVFSRLKQRVLWKWNGEMMADLPKNVMLSKWLPQQDILGHPKIKLFMTHGGLLSTQESVYHGVPVLGLPVFGDQDLNVKQAEKRGYAKFVELIDMTEEKLETALNELLNNPIYTAKVKELSKLVKDLPETPLEKALYWTEYVLRHKGAVHLRSAARDLNFFQYYILDVIAVLTVVTALTLFIIFKTCKACCRKICGKGRKVKGE